MTETGVRASADAAARQVASRADGLRASFLGFMSAFCTGVAIVTSVDDGGRPHGLTCTSLASVTLGPPMLLVCLNTSSGTSTAVRQRAGFAVNLLHERGRAAADVFSSDVEDRFDRVAWRPSAGLAQPWLIDDAFAMAECEVAETVPMGDHVVVFGRVVHVEHGAGVPLLYGMRTFSRW